MNRVELTTTLADIIKDNSHYTTWTVSTPHLLMLVEAAVKKEREVWAKDADWCIQNHLEHLIPERIRAQGNK